MAKRILILAFCFFTYQTYAQYESGVTVPDSTMTLITDESDLSVKYANTILAEDMKRHLTILASDDFEGRETGTAGNNKAARYISNFFRTLELGAPGVEGQYFQNVAFSFTKWVGNT